jgi:hypothetical protein
MKPRNKVIDYYQTPDMLAPDPITCGKPGVLQVDDNFACLEHEAELRELRELSGFNWRNLEEI